MKHNLIFTGCHRSFYDGSKRKIFTPASDGRWTHRHAAKTYDIELNSLATMKIEARMMKNKSLNSLNIQFTFSICLAKEKSIRMARCLQIVLHCTLRMNF